MSVSFLILYQGNFMDPETKNERQRWSVIALIGLGVALIAFAVI